MVHENNITFELFASGYCTAPERVVNPKTGTGTARFYAVWALMQHPAFGTMLFDCGYNEQFHNITKRFPEILYRLATPVYVEEAETAKSIISARGISAESVDYIILSHFHADHICGISDFPNAKFICNRSSIEELRRLSGLNAVRKGILTKLLPTDFESRIIILQDISESYTEVHSGLTFYNIFGQDMFQLVELPGHATGMLGLRADVADRKILYCTDASWDKAAFDQNILPMKVITLFIDSWNAYKQTIVSIKSFETFFPDYTILFTHCPQTLPYLNNYAV